MPLWMLMQLTRKYRAPAGDDGDGGGAVDRGDDWTPTTDEAPESPDQKAQRLEREAETRRKDEEAAAKAKAKPEGSADADDKKNDVEDASDKENGSGDKKKDTRIPLKRHEALLAKERERREELERQIKGFQGSQQVANTNEELTKAETKIVDLEKQYAKALTDGDVTKAAALMADIRKTERRVSELNAAGKIAAAEARAIETTRYQVALERIEAQYPELNEDAEEYDEDTYKEVVDLMNAYRASGRTPTEALQKAVKVLLGARTSAQKAATTVKPRVDTDEVDPEKLKAERKKAAVDKALDAVDKSPATATTKAGLNSDSAGAQRTAKDVIKMSQADFAKIDEKELARLRGDEVDA